MGKPQLEFEHDAKILRKLINLRRDIFFFKRENGRKIKNHKYNNHIEQLIQDGKRAGCILQKTPKCMKEFIAKMRSRACNTKSQVFSEEIQSAVHNELLHLFETNGNRMPNMYAEIILANLNTIFPGHNVLVRHIRNFRKSYGHMFTEEAGKTVGISPQQESSTGDEDEQESTSTDEDEEVGETSSSRRISALEKKVNALEQKIEIIEQENSKLRQLFHDAK